MPRWLHSPALVLRSQPHGESDLILSVLTPDHGRISWIVKGGKRSKKRFLNKLEPYTLLDATWVASRSGLHRLERAETGNLHPELRRDPQRFAAAGVLAEQLHAWTREANPEPETFHLGRVALDRLQNDDPRVLPVAVARLLALQGYRPSLDGCATCGRRRSRAWFFAAHRHGLLCPPCAATVASRLLVPACAGTVAFLRQVLSSPEERLERLHASRASLAETLDMVMRYAGFLLQRDLPAWEVHRALAGREGKRHAGSRNREDDGRAGGYSW